MACRHVLGLLLSHYAQFIIGHTSRLLREARLGQVLSHIVYSSFSGFLQLCLRRGLQRQPRRWKDDEAYPAHELRHNRPVLVPSCRLTN
jgi:hypothetical protein